MNRKITIKLLIFILSIICAVPAAIFCHYTAEKKLHRNEHALQAEQNTQFDESVNGKFLMDEWRMTETAEEQQRLWMEWTQLKLYEEPQWLSAKHEDIHPVYELIKLLEDPRELERLKAEGWHTLEGESLHLTPEQVWYLRHYLNIYNLKDLVRSSRIRFYAASPIGALLGFYCMWLVYVVTHWIICPVFTRIMPSLPKGSSLGSSEDSQS